MKDTPMTQVKNIQKVFKVFKVFMMTMLLASIAPSQVMAHEQYENHGKSCHKKHRYQDDDNHHRNHYSSKEQCKNIVQEFQISRYVTYSESGLLCRNERGNWQVVTPTQYPSLFGKVYFIEHGRKVLFGDVAPRQNSYKQQKYYDYDGVHDKQGWDEEPTYDYLDKKNHYFH